MWRVCVSSSCKHPYTLHVALDHHDPCVPVRRKCRSQGPCRAAISGPKVLARSLQPAHGMRRRTKVWLVLGGLVVLLIGARLIAPYYIVRYVNQTLQGLDGYTGQVVDIDLGIIRGAYVIKGLEIEKTTKKEPIPFVSIDRVDISVHWGALLKGSIV